MNPVRSDELRSAIREVVRDFVHQSVLDPLSEPTGPTSASIDPETADWCASLPAASRGHLERIVSAAIDETIDGVLGVLDDACGLVEDPDTHEVCFVVTHEDESDIL